MLRLPTLLPETMTQCRRIVADGGTIVDQKYMDRTIRILKAQGVYSSCKFLADANMGVKKDGANAVSKLYDLSGNNNDAVQTTGANQPIWTANVQGGRAGLVFDGTNDYLSCGTALGKPANWSTILAAKVTNVAVSLYSIGSFEAAGDGKTSWSAIPYGVIVSGSVGYGFGDGTNKSSGYSASGTIVNNVSFILSEVYTPGENYVRMFKNSGSELAVTKTLSAATSTAGTAYEFAIGRPGAYNGQYHAGSVMNLLVTNISLTTAQRTALESFVNAYYSIY